MKKTVLKIGKAKHFEEFQNILKEGNDPPYAEDCGGIFREENSSWEKQPKTAEESREYAMRPCKRTMWFGTYRPGGDESYSIFRV